MKKNHYEIDEKIYQRFDQKNDMFCRYLWDKRLRIYQNNFAIDMLKNIKKHTEGYTHFDYAFSKASWTVYNRFPFAFSWEGDILFEEDWYGYKLREQFLIHWPQPMQLLRSILGLELECISILPAREPLPIPKFFKVPPKPVIS